MTQRAIRRCVTSSSGESQRNNGSWLIFIATATATDETRRKTPQTVDFLVSDLDV